MNEDSIDTHYQNDLSFIIILYSLLWCFPNYISICIIAKSN